MNTMLQCFVDQSGEDRREEDGEIKKRLLRIDEAWLRAAIPPDTCIAFIANSSVCTVKRYADGAIALWTWDHGSEEIKSVMPRRIANIDTVLAVYAQLSMSPEKSTLEFLDEDQIDAFLL